MINKLLNILQKILNEIQNYIYKIIMIQILYNKILQINKINKLIAKKFKLTYTIQ